MSRLLGCRFLLPPCPSTPQAPIPPDASAGKSADARGGSLHKEVIRSMRSRPGGNSKVPGLAPLSLIDGSAPILMQLCVFK